MVEVERLLARIFSDKTEKETFTIEEIQTATLAVSAYLRKRGHALTIEFSKTFLVCEKPNNSYVEHGQSRRLCSVSCRNTERGKSAN